MREIDSGYEVCDEVAVAKKNYNLDQSELAAPMAHKLIADAGHRYDQLGPFGILL